MLLKSIGFDKETVLEWNDLVHSRQWVELKPLYEETLHKMCICSRCDGIVYQNDYEADVEQDPTCYIVFSPNQVKSIDPIYGQDGKLMPLSQRFDPNSPKFTK